MDYVNSLGDGPLGGSQVDQGLASRWADRIHKWDGNLFLAANGDPGGAALIKKSACTPYNLTPQLSSSLHAGAICKCIVGYQVAAWLHSATSMG